MVWTRSMNKRLRNVFVYSRNVIVYSRNVIVYSQNVIVYSWNVIVYFRNVIVYFRNVIVYSQNVIVYSWNVIVHSRNVNVYSRMILIKMSNVLRKGPSSERNVSFFSISTFFYTVQVGKRYCTAWEILNNVLNRDFMSYCRLVYIFRMIGNVWILVCLKALKDVNIQPLTYNIF